MATHTYMYSSTLGRTLGQRQEWVLNIFIQTHTDAVVNFRFADFVAT